ncbi:HEAT repeat domain-containing protein [Streptomyces sp. NPDC088387]|uniref:HEAT repeat domain-containing protein n=1 Tax=Streptomyces sp. NPDC088387 TaxID=3365859 RepID=UPI00381B7698
MFTGIDDIDWASLRHAYGSARDVPGLVRGLASDDPAERETALDGMYGTVHDQGRVYDSTLACVPFLLALAAREEGRDRAGIVELLVSIGSGSGARDAGTGAHEDEAGAPEEQAGDLYGLARAAVRAGAPVFVRLAGDADAGVRRAVPPALVGFLDEPAHVLGVLRERIRVERDDRVLITLTEGLGTFARRHPPYSGPALDLLAVHSAPPNGPVLRLAALGQLAAHGPERLPDDLVPTAVRLLRERSQGRCAERCRPVKDTLSRHVRRLRPSDEEGARLLGTLHSALDDRIPDRRALLNGQLSSPSASDRCNAVRMAAGLLREWRGDHTESVRLIGAQLAAEESGLRDAAVSVLVDLFEPAAPAADALHELAAARPDLWVRAWGRGRPVLGGPLKALARTGDRRATPLLAKVLAGPVVPDDLGLVLAPLGREAAPLAPALRRELAVATPDSPTTAARIAPLLTALTDLGDEAAVSEAVRLLEDSGAEPTEPVARAAIRALGAFGPAAGAGVPVLRGLLDGEFGAVAAGALWSVQGDASAVLPVLLRELAAGDLRRRTAAAEEVARLGPSALPALSVLRDTMDMAGAGAVRERVAAAYALWRIGEDAEPALPVLRAAWTRSPSVRVRIAECLREMAPAGAPLRDLVAAERAAPRRHLAGVDGRAGDGVPEDERLLRLCRELLEGT